MFEIVDGRRTTYDGRAPEHGYTISSPCEPEGSGELKNITFVEGKVLSKYAKFRLHPSYGF